MRAGAAEVIYLVPELCRMTGLSDEMRNNFQLMKAIADRTRTNPQQRVNNLLKFAQRMLQKQTVCKKYFYQKFYNKRQKSIILNKIYAVSEPLLLITFIN